MAQIATDQPQGFSQNRSRKSERRTAARLFLAVFTTGLAGCIGLWAWGADAWVYLALGLLFAGALVAIDPVMRRPGGIPCLTWHSVSADPGWLPWAANTSVTPATLNRQLSILRRLGLEPLDTRDFCALRRAGRDVPANAVILHFDDGYRDNLIAAAPILAEHGMKATLFVSLDFIAPDRRIATPIDLGTNRELGSDYAGPWDGYLSWREIRELDQGALKGVLDVQPHGVDHGRVATSGKAVDVLNASNWRQLAWMQWAKMPGDKHDWYLNDLPPAVPIGTEVPESGSALAARAWTPGDGLEPAVDFEIRVMADFQACFDAFARELDKTPEIFCWPQNLATPQVRALARRAGFVATTAGEGSNRMDENPQIISRLHVGERYAGFAIPWLDDLAFRASVRAFQGNTYWYLLLIPIHGLGRLYWRMPKRVSAAMSGRATSGLAQ